jgi:hypothetical protein
MRTFKKYSAELGRTVAITYNGRALFTTPTELAKGAVLVQTVIFAAILGKSVPSQTRSFTLKFFNRGLSMIEGGDNGRTDTHELFGTKSEASRAFEATLAQYKADPRWVRL